MELNEIVDTADVCDLIDQYIEVAVTSEQAFQISPIPDRFKCTVVFPSEDINGHRMSQFTRDYREAVLERWDRVMKFQGMIGGRNPVLLIHPLSTQLVCQVGHGFACADIADAHLSAIKKHMGSIGACFDGSPAADPLPAGRTNKAVVPLRSMTRQNHD